MENLFVENVREKLFGVLKAVNRYPLAVTFLGITAIVNILMIQSDEQQYANLFWTFIIGAFLSVVFQQVYERFFFTMKQRLSLQVVAVLLTVGYYFAIRSAATFNMEAEIKTTVIIFALSMVLIWIPSIKNKILFNETFMATFKAFFITFLFTAVIAIGLNLSIFAVDQLLVPVDGKVYAHVFNLIFTLFAPIFFLSLIPLYPGRGGRMTDEQKTQLAHAITCPKTLASLLSYVLIPLTGLYTLILLVYILLNIGGKFWTNNLLEPLLVSYAITVILVTVLAGSLTDSFASFSKKVFPKVLLPIVLFQLVASALKIGEIGITHGRYYVLLFGLFALVSSIIFSFFPVQKSGRIAMFLIGFAAVSIIPPVDAFTISRVNQTNMLQKTLSVNDMFVEGKILPNSDISTADKKKITETVQYLSSMQYAKEINWLPDKLEHGNVFRETFGFDQVYDEGNTVNNGKSVYVDWEQHPVIDINNYDRLVRFYLYQPTTNKQERNVFPMHIDDVKYDLVQEFEDGKMHLIFKDDEKEFMRFDLKAALDEILMNQGELSIEEATITKDNEEVRMTVIANTIDVYDGSYSGEINVLIEVKK